MSKISILINIVLLCFISFVSRSEGEYMGKCITPLKGHGKCVPIKSCDTTYGTLLNVLKFREEGLEGDINLMQQSQCDIVDTIPHVCCLEEHIQINPAVYEYLRKLNCGYNGSGRIANGEKAGLRDYRWMALLKYNDKEQFACGGSLISDRYVLTAAHCLHNFRNLPVAVRLGEYDLSTDIDCLQYGSFRKCFDPVLDIPIERIIPHEDYIYKGIHHDIALLRLEQPVKFTKFILPICLPISETLQSTVSDNYIAAGWGKTEHGKRSNVLQFTNLPNHDIDVCESQFNLDFSNEHICAGGIKFQDTCKGDSGGPLFYPNIYEDGTSKMIQYGVVSFGVNTCGEVNVPAIYTNVSHYIQWITDHMEVEL